MLKTKLITSSLALGLIFSSAQAAVSVQCSDTDGGNNPDVKGTVTVKIMKGDEVYKERSLTDVFARKRGKYLEFYCNGNMPAYAQLECTSTSTYCPKNTEATAVSVSVGRAETEFSDMIVANQVDKRILNFWADAGEESLTINEFNFFNRLDNDPIINAEEIASANRYTYKLYSDNGSLLSRAEANQGEIKFVLSNPITFSGMKNFSVMVDAKNITDPSQSWQKLRILLSRNIGVVGENAQGSPIEKIFASQLGEWPISQTFVNTKTKISIRHATLQPSIADPSIAEQDFYRFTVSADSAGDAELATIVLNVETSGMNFSAKPVVRVLPVNTNGTIDVTGNVANAKFKFIGDSNTSGRIIVDFSNGLIKAGESKSFAVLMNNTQNDVLAISDDDSIAFSIKNNKYLGAVGSKAERKGFIWWSDLTGTMEVNRFKRGTLIDMDTTAFMNRD